MTLHDKVYSGEAFTSAVVLIIPVCLGHAGSAGDLSLQEHIWADWVRVVSDAIQSGGYSSRGESVWS